MELKTNTGSAVTISDEAFGREFNESLVHQVITAYMAGARQGTKAQKSRAEVRGGGIKPWRQKGTGRARAGTSSSPIWRAGGVTFARSEEHTSELQSRPHLVCRLLLEKKKADTEALAGAGELRVQLVEVWHDEPGSRRGGGRPNVRREISEQCGLTVADS